MALFDEVTEDEDFAEEMEFTGEVRLMGKLLSSPSYGRYPESRG